MTERHSHSFYLASRLLPAEERRAIRTLYAFCRTSDDIVDRPAEDPQAELAAWRRRTLSVSSPPDDLVAVAWADVRARYQIPSSYVTQLLDGVAHDLQPVRYESFDELAAYCYAVASTVGLMSMHIVGYSGPEAIPYAVKMGVALQLTNILRDVGEDWQSGRLYLPQEELAAFGLRYGDLAAGEVDNRWRAFMRFQIERTRRLYEESWPGILMLDKRAQLAIAAADGLYAAILDDIEANDYNVFTRRATVSTWSKLPRLVGIWQMLRRERARGPN